MNLFYKDYKSAGSPGDAGYIGYSWLPTCRQKMYRPEASDDISNRIRDRGS